MNTQLLGRARAFANGLSNTQGLGEEGVTGSIIFEERGQTQLLHTKSSALMIHMVSHNPFALSVAGELYDP